MMQNLKYCEVENEVLRERLAALKKAVKAQLDATDAYLWKAGPRSVLVNSTEDLRRLL